MTMQFVGFQDGPLRSEAMKRFDSGSALHIQIVIASSDGRILHVSVRCHSLYPVAVRPGKELAILALHKSAIEIVPTASVIFTRARPVYRVSRPNRGFLEANGSRKAIG